MIRYFVSYAFHDNRGTGNGCCEIHRTQPIRGMDDIAAITEVVRQQGVANPTILSFSRFDDPTLTDPAGPLDRLAFEYVRHLLQHKPNRPLTIEQIAQRLDFPAVAVRRIVEAAANAGRLTQTRGGYTLPREGR